MDGRLGLWMPLATKKSISNLVWFKMNIYILKNLLLEVPKHDAKPIAWSPLWSLFFLVARFKQGEVL